ncbi:MAG: DUF4321 domain-containing protein [Peptococcaceae bacterium]|nr:DUF4321 domain-containing protein [Peptococcaceae bacterium]
MVRTRGGRNPWLLITLLIVCGIIGGFIGLLLQPLAPWAGNTLLSLGTSSFTLDLYVITITLGAALHLNLFTVIGFAAAIVIFFCI